MSVEQKLAGRSCGRTPGPCSIFTRALATAMCALRCVCLARGALNCNASSVARPENEFDTQVNDSVVSDRDTDTASPQHSQWAGPSLDRIRDQTPGALSQGKGFPRVQGPDASLLTCSGVPRSRTMGGARSSKRGQAVAYKIIPRERSSYGLNVPRLKEQSQSMRKV